MQTLPVNSGTMMRKNSPAASSRASLSMPSTNCRHSRPCAQLTSFSGFRRANEVDAAGSHTKHATLKAVVSKSSLQSRRGGGHKVTRMMFERFTEKVRVAGFSSHKVYFASYNIAVGSLLCFLALTFWVHLLFLCPPVSPCWPAHHIQHACVTSLSYRQAIKVVMLAQEEARRLGHNFVGTEQILLGLIGESTGIAAKVLKSMGVNLKDARVEVEKIIGAPKFFSMLLLM